MVVGASSSARAHGIDRFYTPPAVRRQQQQQQQQRQQEQQQQSPKKASRTKPRRRAANSPAIDEARAESDDSSSKSAVTSSSNSNSNSSSVPLPNPAGNLDRFIESITPVVPSRYHRKMSVRRWSRSDNVESCPYFDLEDLWESFREWSAYGAGVPLVLNGEAAVIQYYVPYLSGIQLYVHSSRHSLRSRQSGNESDDEAYQDTSSEASSNSDSHVDQAARPIFEYLARDLPYGREPLSDKISALASKFPGLRTYKSCDLLPSSWMCVAWYPIYRIPTGHTLKDLDACFLTFHLLSTPSNNLSNGHSLCNGVPSSVRSQMPQKLPVPVFGLASYKLQGSIWTCNGHHEQEQANSLLQAAADWLQLLNVDHPDFQFFLSRYNTSWR